MKQVQCLTTLLMKIQKSTSCDRSLLPEDLVPLSLGHPEYSLEPREKQGMVLGLEQLLQNTSVLVEEARESIKITDQARSKDVFGATVVMGCTNTRALRHHSVQSKASWIVRAMYGILHSLFY